MFVVFSLPGLITLVVVFSFTQVCKMLISAGALVDLADDEDMVGYIILD